MMSEEYKQNLIQKNYDRYKEILDPLYEDIKNYQVPMAYIKNKYKVEPETIKKYLYQIYGLKIDWKKIDRKSKYYGIAFNEHKSKKGLPQSPKKEFIPHPKTLPIIDKKEFVKNYKLPEYIKNHINNFGCTVISDSIYKRLGATGVRFNIKRQFKLDVILEIVNERTCIVYTKGNRP